MGLLPFEESQYSFTQQSPSAIEDADNELSHTMRS
ncbi:hypothetical protein VV93_v1c19460 [Vibrio vulnificus]|nr:hypothetical protein VV93_v1c19460 [Vibrio vulnificus]OJI37523.1 hypothetical protein VVDAL79087_03310 [Vibrio vulnificus]